MEKRKKWREPTSGPDCLDVMTILSAIGTLHSGHVALIVSPAGTGSPTSVDIAASILLDVLPGSAIPAGTGSPTSVDIAASILLDVLPGSAIPAGIGAHSEWPNKSGSSFWGECYKLCWSLDEEIGKVYKQEALWE